MAGSNAAGAYGRAGSVYGCGLAGVAIRDSKLRKEAAVAMPAVLRKVRFCMVVG